jgi:hypothetical protein
MHGHIDGRSRKRTKVENLFLQCLAVSVKESLGACERVATA